MSDEDVVLAELLNEAGDRPDLHGDLGHPTPDFTITVRANLDSRYGVPAEGAAPGPVQDSDFAHVRNWVHGMILNMAGALPVGWDIDVAVLHDTHGQHDSAIDPRKPVLTVAAPDRFAAVETARCAACGGSLRRENPDDIWYHLIDCADPTPVIEPKDTLT